MIHGTPACMKPASGGGAPLGPATVVSVVGAANDYTMTFNQPVTRQAGSDSNIQFFDGTDWWGCEFATQAGANAVLIRVDTGMFLNATNWQIVASPTLVTCVNGIAFPQSGAI